MATKAMVARRSGGASRARQSKAWAAKFSVHVDVGVVGVAAHAAVGRAGGVESLGDFGESFLVSEAAEEKPMA